MSSENVDRAERIMSSMPLDNLADAIRDTGRVEALAASLEPVLDLDRDRALKAAGLSE